MEKIHVDLLRKLKEEMERAEISYKENVPMSSYTSFRAGGNAALMAAVRNADQLKTLLQIACIEKVPHILLGNGSNTLFKDSGYDGIVIKLSDDMAYAHVLEDGLTVKAGASILLSSLSKILLNENLTGFEFASGIPGSLGGALFMNAGAYGGEMKHVVKEVRAVSPDGLHEKIFSAEEMKFGYRHSILQENGYIAVEAAIGLKKGDHEKIAHEMRSLAEKRNSKQPVSYPSAGSTFKRPEGYFAGKLIEEAGLKGVTVGGAQVSALHSGFIINTGGATATDIIELIKLVQNTVYDKSGVMLAPEVRIIG